MLREIAFRVLAHCEEFNTWQPFKILFSCLLCLLVQILENSLNSFTDELNDRATLSSIRLHADLWPHMEQDVPWAHGLCFASSANVHTSYMVGGGWAEYTLQRKPWERFVSSLEICIAQRDLFSAARREDRWVHFCNLLWAISTPPVYRRPRRYFLP